MIVNIDESSESTLRRFAIADTIYPCAPPEFRPDGLRPIRQARIL